jgi:Fur family iron response transcriptional regulator
MTDVDLHYRELEAKLRAHGLRPTIQRMSLGVILFGADNKHVTAESLHAESKEANIGVCLATVYNALHNFTSKGLLKEICIDPSRSYFDTNTEPHHHFYYERSGRLEDIMCSDLSLGVLPAAPDNLPLLSVEVLIRIDG